MNDSSRKNLANYRMVQATQALEDGKMLLAGGSMHGAANRIYYAVFYCASALAASRGAEFSKHAGVISFFDKEFVKAGMLSAALSKTLHDAFAERQEDDYVPFAQPTRKTVTDLLDRATEFLAEARRLLEEDGVLSLPPSDQ